MFCSKCGASVPAESTFCSQCGTRVGAQAFPTSQSEETPRQSPAPAYPPGVAPYPPKSRTVAGILGILLGGIGVHRFYLGYVGIGLLQIFVSIITAGVGMLWGFIEGIVILVGNWPPTDANGVPLQR